MNDTTTVSATPGRPVRLVPVPPGFWMTLLGVGLAALAPLFGFLVGRMVGAGEGGALFSPMYRGLFRGVVVGHRRIGSVDSLLTPGWPTARSLRLYWLSSSQHPFSE